MSSVVMAIAVDDMAAGPLGVKEAAVMALEPLGGVRVLWIEDHEPEQLGLAGLAPAQPPAPAGGQALPGRVPAQQKRRRPVAMASCLSCGCFWESHGQDERGKLYWGICRNTSKPVYELSARCAAWKGAT